MSVLHENVKKCRNDTVMIGFPLFKEIQFLFSIFRVGHIWL
jgi:hypothetical protein